MKKNIITKDNGLEIKISGIDSNQEELLSNFQLCQQGKCDCPTDEYSKLEKLDINSSETEIVLNLKSKSGQSFKKDEVEKCITFVVDKVSKNKTV